MLYQVQIHGVSVTVTKYNSNRQSNFNLWRNLITYPQTTTTTSAAKDIFHIYLWLENTATKPELELGKINITAEYTAVQTLVYTAVYVYTVVYAEV